MELSTWELGSNRIMSSIKVSNPTALDVFRLSILIWMEPQESSKSTTLMRMGTKSCLESEFMELELVLTKVDSVRLISSARTSKSLTTKLLTLITLTTQSSTLVRLSMSDPFMSTRLLFGS